jgi:hypothetical protein
MATKATANNMQKNLLMNFNKIFSSLDRTKKRNIVIGSVAAIATIIFGFFLVSSLLGIKYFSNAVTDGYGCGNFGTAGGLYGSDCGVVIAIANIQTSTNCINTLNVTIGNTYTCTFPLIGSTTNSYSLPTTGVLAGSSTLTTKSQPCTIINGGTAQAALECTGIATIGGSAGVKDVLIFVNGATVGVDKGDVNFISTSTPLANSDFALTNPNLNLVCEPAAVNLTTNCTFTLPPDKTLPANFQFSIGNGISGGACTLNPLNRLVTCTGVPTGTQIGNQKIYSYIGGTKTDTTKLVNIIAATVPTSTTPATNPVISAINSTLPRTGGGKVLVGVSIVAIFVGILIGVRRFEKKKSMKTDLDEPKM